jgi:hypothetical protein
LPVPESPAKSAVMPRPRDERRQTRELIGRDDEVGKRHGRRDTPGTALELGGVLGAGAAPQVGDAHIVAAQRRLLAGRDRSARDLLRPEPELGGLGCQIELVAAGAALAPPRGPFLGRREADLHEHRHRAGVRRVPRARAVQDRGRRELGERAHGRRPALEQRVDRPADAPGVAQQRLAPGDARERRDRLLGREPPQIERERGCAELADRGQRQPGRRAVARLAQVREPRARAQRAGERNGIAAGRGPAAAEQRQQGRVRPIVAEQEHRHAVGHAQAARQEGAIGILDLDQARVDQRRAWLQAGACGRARRYRPRKLEREPDARPPARDVVVQVAVERLEACIQVGGERDEQQLEVGRDEPEDALEMA